MILWIEPLGIEEIMPAFVIGYEFDDDQLLRINEKENLPNWFISLRQQAGGYSMRYPSVSGAVLRLASNLDRMGTQGYELVAGLQLMAEDPNIPELEAKFPILRKLVYIGDYNADHLQQLQTFLAQYLTLPPIETGIEAYIQFALCDPLDYFGGWHVMQYKYNDPVSGSIYLDSRNFYWVEEGNLSDLILTDDIDYASELNNWLTKIALSEGIDSPPRIFLLWENSD
ncbi:MAG TPA: hypothetical protein VHL11_13285 [Phototrophicaceae bacterium]|nr:hypothetical protein [Phototrophicaceae bacterium]